MRKLLFTITLMLAVPACSSDEPFVDELTTNSQINLCEDFLDDYCTTPNGAGFCNSSCINTGCLPAVENGDIDFECQAVFVSEVEDCGFTGASIDCPVGGGGCIIDALQGNCP